MLEVQAQERLNVVRRFQRHFEAVVSNLQQCLKDVPDDLLLPAPSVENEIERGIEPMDISETGETRQRAVSVEHLDTVPVESKNDKDLDWLMCKIMDHGKGEASNQKN